MILVYATCSACNGAGGRYAEPWDRCAACDGLGRQWAPGAPTFGCSVMLADREPGEIVTLGTGQRVKILWHMPRKTKKVRPETTFVDVLSEFYEAETYIPVPYPSCVGVSSVDASVAAGDSNAHGGERAVDVNDPMQRRYEELWQHSVRAADEPF